MRKFYSWLQRISRTTKPRLAYAVLMGVILTFSTGSQAQKAGTSLSYDGVNDFITLPGNLVSGLSSEFTIEAWVYWKGGCPAAGEQPTWQRILDFGTDESNYMFLVPQSNFGGGTGVMFAMVVAGAVEYIQSPAPLATHSWHHIAVTVNSANAGYLFIDGQLSGTGYITGRPSAFGTAAQNWLAFSRFQPLYGDPFFFGNIDEFRISDNIRYTSNFFPQTADFTADGNTVSLFHFNEGAGNSQSLDVSGQIALLGHSAVAEASDPSWMVGSLLPVTMLEFSGHKGQNSVLLKWKAEVKGEGGAFVIERSSDGLRFQPIGSVPILAGSGMFSFSFADAMPGSGKNYYRLKIAENNTDPKYTSIVLVDLRSRSMYTLYPNITAGELFIGTPGPVHMSIYNSAGLLVKRIRLSASQTINISDLRAGSYFVKFEGSQEVYRVVKK